MDSSSQARYLLTGATGLLGRNVAKRLVESGHRVTALARFSSDTAELEKIGVTVVRGELTDGGFVDANVSQSDIVVNCAAKITNWGSWDDFERGNIVPAERLVSACDRFRVQRLVHISSIAVYGHPKNVAGKNVAGKNVAGQITEASPVGQRLLSFDYYNRSKIASENLIRGLGPQATILRPTWFIGPGDRVLVPAVVRKLRKGAVWLIGSGDNLLNGLAVEDVADGVVSAATAKSAGGRTLNLCSSGEISQQEFLDVICEAISIPHVRRRMPLFVVERFAWVVENFARLRRCEQRPFLTRHDLSVFTRPVHFSNQAAFDVMGWSPKVALKDSLIETLRWYLDQPDGSVKRAD